MKIKKIISLILSSLILFSGIQFTLASEILNYQRGKELAEKYIKNSLDDELWKNNNPQITKETFFYTDNEKKASYIEFKVSCNNKKDCGFIIVNIDWDDVAIPIASPEWIWPSEILLLQMSPNSKNYTNDNKFYYFSPFEQYIENKKTKEIFSINKEENIDFQINSFILKEKMSIIEELYKKDLAELEKNNEENIEKNDINKVNLTKEEFLEKIINEYEDQIEKNTKLNNFLNLIELDKVIIDSKRIELENMLERKLEELKSWVKEYKKTEDFKIQKEKIKDQILNIKDEKFVIKSLDMSFASYNPWTNISNIFVSWINAPSSSWCSWKVPCYNQMFNSTYNWINCNVAGCTPTALWIIYWYYALNNRYTLFPNSNNLMVKQYKCKCSNILFMTANVNILYYCKTLNSFYSYC